MSKVIRVGITDEDWNELEPFLTHHGQLSYILRQAIHRYIKEARGETNGGGGKGNRSTQSRHNLDRRGTR